MDDRLIGVTQKQPLPRVRITVDSFRFADAVEAAFDNVNELLQKSGGQLIAFNITPVSTVEGVRWAVVAQYINSEPIRLARKG